MRRPTILTGPNDSGKSATIDALAFLLGAYQIQPEDRTFDPEADGAESEVRVDSTWVEGDFMLSRKEQADLTLPDRVQIRRISAKGSGPRLEVRVNAPVDEDLRNLDSKSLTDLKAAADRLGVTVTTDARAKANWESALKRFAETRPTEWAWVTAGRDVGLALPRFLRFGSAESAELAVKVALNSRYKAHLEDEDLKQRVEDLERELGERVRADAQGLIDHIKRRCTDLVLVDVEPDVSFTSGLRSTKVVLARTDGETVSLASVGSGRSRRIGLAIWEWTSDLLRQDAEGQSEAAGPQHVVLAYDEPDTHLDYLQQRRVMAIIREQCRVPSVRMLIATHSMNLIDGAAVEDIVHLTLSGERTQASSLLSDFDDDANRFLADIAAALGLRNTVLLHERCFVGVEGPTEQQSFPLLFKLATGRAVHSAGIVIVGCNNNEGAVKFIGYLARSNRQVMLIIDADSRKNKLFSDANLAKEGIDVLEHVRFLGEPDKELESLFSDQQWCDVANKVWPRKDDRPWQPGDVDALRDGKFSASLLNLFREESLSGPASKPSMMYEMARSLSDAGDVPGALRDAFLQLEKLAALDS